MKKQWISLVLALALALFAVCASAEDVLTIGVMSGPTGMGMAQLMNAGKENYRFEIYSAPTNATADLASGALDLLCLPTNTAANLAASKEDFVTVLAVNCLGSLYLLTDGTVEIGSAADLEGQTVWASVPSSTTAPILDYILKQNGVNADVQWEADHDALAAQMIQGNVHIAVLPEPKATVAMSKAENWKIALNLSEEWNKVCDTALPMGCIVASNAALRDHADAVEQFLQEYSASVAFIGAEENLDASAQMIAAAGILPSEGVAKKALKNLFGSIVYMDGNEMKTCLQAFYDVIGQPQPADSFYYAK